MKYPAYPKYKDSGVEWLGEVPEHWEVKKIKYVGMIRYGLGEPPEFSDDGLPFIRATDIYRGRIVLDSVKKVDPGDVPWKRCPQLEKNEIIVVRSGAYTGDSAIVDDDTAGSIVGYDMVLNVRTAIPCFLSWVLLSKYMLEGQIHLSRLRAAQPHLNADDLGNFTVFTPPLPEQRAIAAFLDAQTSKLDALIAKELELIDKLKEKRAALITRTVTRGLPPDAAKAAGLDPHPKMKDSGVEWLGDVPEHWEVSRFSREVFIAEGQVNPELDPYLNMFLIAPNHVESESGRLIAKETAIEQCAESGKYYCKSGDVIYSKIRPNLAKVAMAAEDCLCSADMYPLRSHSRLYNKFLYWTLLSSWFVAWSILESDRVAMPKINRESLGGCQLCIPPLPEQRAIAAYLDRETAAIDALVAKVETAIERLQEYRAALITAAVTGQIDVRQQGD